MSIIRFRRIIAAFALAALAASLGAQERLPFKPSRVVLGGRAVAMVADALYAFPEARSSVVSIAGTDQGLGTFLEAVEPGFLAKPGLDRSAGAEAYAALRPDLVILKSGMKASLGAGLSALRVPTLYVELETPEDYYADLAAIGRVYGAERRAVELIAYYKEIVDRVESTARLARAAGAAQPRVLVVQASAGAYQLPPDAWIQTRMVEMAGGAPVWKGQNPGSGWTTVGAEQIAAWNPDIVVIISYREDASKLAKAFAADPRFAGLRAVRDGRVRGYAQDFYSWDQPDTRWGLGLLWMSKLLHPERQRQLSLETEARRFFKLFYGLGDAAFEATILPRAQGDWLR